MGTAKGLREGWVPVRSRREFLSGGLAFSSLALRCSTICASAFASKSTKTLAYVGTYTEGSNGSGIYVFEMDLRSGVLSGGRLASNTTNPSWLVIHPSRRYLYAVNEIDNFQGESGSVCSFAIDDESGALTPINAVASGGKGPAYISIDGSGRFAFVANYGDGSLTVLPIRKDGALETASDRIRDTGSVGQGMVAKDAPRGSFARSGHDHPHVHMIAPDSASRFVLATDLGQDRIYSYELDRTTGQLTPARGAEFVALPPGDGPRHFAFHPNGRWLYVILEESSTIAAFRYESEKGAVDLDANGFNFAGKFCWYKFCF